MHRLVVITLILVVYQFLVVDVSSRGRTVDLAIPVAAPTPPSRPPVAQEPPCNCVRPDGKRNVSADVTEVSLDETDLYIPCPYPQTSPTPPAKMHVDVTTKADDEEGDILLYRYEVSGGKIIGQGAHVKWDLTGATPGTYEIVVSVDDGCGFCGAKVKRTVTVSERNCSGDCECPTLSVSGSYRADGLNRTAIFSAVVVGGPQVEFSWTVSAGKIVKGQGSPEIEVDLAGDLAWSDVVGTVEIKGLDPYCNCPTKASSKVTIVNK